MELRNDGSYGMVAVGDSQYRERAIRGHFIGYAPKCQPEGLVSLDPRHFPMPNVNEDLRTWSIVVHYLDRGVSLCQTSA